jgi:TonB family protein
VSNGAAASEHDEHVTRHVAPSGRHPSSAVAAGRGPARAVAPLRQPAALGNVFAARVFGLFGISMGVHMSLLAVLGLMPSPEARLREQVEMEIAAAPDPEPPPPPPPAEPPKQLDPPAARPKAAPKLAPKVAATPEPPHPEARAAAEGPVDLTGVTLTGGDGSSWSSVVGNGQALSGPAARIGKVTGKDRPGETKVSARNIAPVVSEGSLSRKPVPPDGMDALLVQYYPARARAQGVAGSALLRVRIMADGEVANLRLVRESDDYGFGDACMKLLRLRRWHPPLDHRGTPVATEISYLCEFEVGN